MERGTVTWFDVSKGYGYIRRDGRGPNLLVTHRPNQEGERGRRELFTNMGEPLEKAQPYRMNDEAGRGAKFVRIVISPDPLFEDTNRDLDMRGATIAEFALRQNAATLLTSAARSAPTQLPSSPEN